MTWLVDGQTFARKVKNPTYGVCGHGGRGRSIECPSCGYVLDQSNPTPEWPGLPAGVKFDPSDQELLEHLAAKVGLDATKLHPFIDEFIPTLEEEDGICYTHPENLPGVRRDGSGIHFFHRPAKAYNTGTRKRRKVQLGEDNGYELRWHKTGRTRPIVENGKQVGCKKIMVLYVSFGKKSKPDKTNWVMHQYHLGVHEEEREGELVVSKVFYQTQPRQSGVGLKENGDDFEHAVMEVAEQRAHSFHYSSTSNFTGSINSQATPSTPKTPAPFQGQAVKQHKGLLAMITEDVDRLNASLSAHSRNTVHSPDQNILAPGFISTAKSVSKNQRAAYDSTEGSLDLGERDTCCSLERRDSRKEHETQPFSRSTTGGIHTSLVDCLSDMPDLEGHQVSDTLDSEVDSEVLKFFSNQMPLKPKSNYDVVVQSIKCEAGETSCKLDSNNGEETGRRVDSALDNIILDTPPEFLMESLMNSQETLDWLGKRKFWSDSSQKTSGSDDGNFLDFLRDSQSSI